MLYQSQNTFNAASKTAPQLTRLLDVGIGPSVSSRLATAPCGLVVLKMADTSSIALTGLPTKRSKAALFQEGMEVAHLLPLPVML